MANSRLVVPTIKLALFAHVFPPYIHVPEHSLPLYHYGTQLDSIDEQLNHIPIFIL